MNKPNTPSRTVTDPSGDSAITPRRALGPRLLGWTLLIASVGLVSCQSLFVL
jgi:hypothetical protein